MASASPGPQYARFGSPPMQVLRLSEKPTEKGIYYADLGYVGGKISVGLSADLARQIVVGDQVSLEGWVSLSDPRVWEGRARLDIRVDSIKGGATASMGGATTARRAAA